MERRILVTGATGFVGSCLTHHLVDKGEEVHVFARAESNLWRLNAVKRDITIHNVDLRSVLSVGKAVDNIRPSIIFHLATHGGYASQKDTINIVESNLFGTINLLNACEKVGFDCFVNTGSSSEYGIKGEAMKESTLLEPLGSYGVSKAATSLYCRSIAIEKELPVITVRLFSPYGAFDDYRRLIPYAITSMLRGTSPSLSTPNSVRDYIYIDDIINFYMNIEKYPIKGGEIFNAGSGNQLSIGHVVNLLTKIIANGIEPVWGAVEKHRPEPSMWKADLTKSKNILNWSPTVSIEEGLKKTVEWFRGNLGLYP